MSDLEEALNLRPSAVGIWSATADARYESLNAMFGGWTSAILLRAVMTAAGCVGEDEGLAPSALTVNYVTAIRPGTELLVEATEISTGRSVSHWSAALRDASGAEEPDAAGSAAHRPLAFATAVLTRRRDTRPHTQGAMPEVPQPEELPQRQPPGPQGSRMLVRIIDADPPFRRGDTHSLDWVREGSGREVDHVQLAFLADAYAPRTFYWHDSPTLSATLTLSVHFHATRAELDAVGDDYVLTEAVGTRGVRSTSGQRARLWSRQGALLATTEQLAWYR